jgi:acylpyruvate hydrolase
MRLGTLAVEGRLEPVALRDGGLVTLPAPVRQLVAQGPEAVRQAVESAGPARSFELGSLGPAIPDPGKVLCIGKNYADHAAELGGEAPERPEVFMRSRTSLAGPGQPIRRPRVSEMMDFEVELAVVIGRRGRYVRPGDALAHVAGYCVFNDVSLRDFQHHGQQWTPGKNFDGTGPLGPFLVTSDEVPDPFHLDLTCAIAGPNGEETMQASNTSLMVHRIPDRIAYLSLFTTLEPGDVICTGTPSGVGMGRTPRRWLQPGETLLSRIEGIGELKNQVVVEDSANP